MSTIDELNRLHEAAPRGEWKPSLHGDYVIAAGSGDDDPAYVAAVVALHNAWPAIHRVLVAARGLMEANNVNNWVLTSDGKLTDHGKLFEALRALDGHQG